MSVSQLRAEVVKYLAPLAQLFREKIEGHFDAVTLA